LASKSGLCSVNEISSISAIAFEAKIDGTQDTSSP